MDEIIPGVLFLSDYLAASDIEELDRNGILTVVNISDSPQSQKIRQMYEDYGIRYVFFPCQDEPGENISRYFSAFLDVMDAAPKPVLVHCRAGVSRSATLAIAFVMVYEKLTVNEAFLHVRKRRPIIGPNSGFMKQLRAWQPSPKPNLNSVNFFLQTLHQWADAIAKNQQH